MKHTWRVKMARYKKSDMRKCAEKNCRNKIRSRVYHANVVKCKLHMPEKYCTRKNCERLCIKGAIKCSRHFTNKRNKRETSTPTTTNPIMEHAINQPDISIIVDGDLTCEQIGGILCIKNIENMILNNVFSIKTYE